MERLFVVPAKECSIIRYPGSDRILSPVGGYVPKNQYWMRRIADKDVLDCTGQKKIDGAKLPEVKESEKKEIKKTNVKKITKNKTK